MSGPKRDAALRRRLTRPGAGLRVGRVTRLGPRPHAGRGGAIVIAFRVRPRRGK